MTPTLPVNQLQDASRIRIPTQQLCRGGHSPFTLRLAFYSSITTLGSLCDAHELKHNRKSNPLHHVVHPKRRPDISRPALRRGRGRGGFSRRRRCCRRSCHASASRPSPSSSYCEQLAHEFLLAASASGLVWRSSVGLGGGQASIDDDGRTIRQRRQPGRPAEGIVSRNGRGAVLPATKTVSRIVGAPVRGSGEAAI